MKLAAADRSLLLRTSEPAALFEQARQLGLQGLEITLTIADLHDPQRLSALRAAKGSLHIPSIRILHEPAIGLENADSVALDAVRQALTWAAELGAATLILPMFVPGEVVSDEDVDRATAHLSLLTAQAEAEGITLCYEGKLSAAATHRLAARVHSSAFGSALDLAHVLWRGMDTPTEILALGGLLKLVRLRDIRVNPGDCALGKGCVDFAACAAALRHIGFDGWLVLDTPSLLPEVFGREISFVRRIFPEIKVDLAWPRIGAFSYVFNERVEDPLGFLIQECQRNGLQSVQLGLRTLDIALQSPESAISVRERLEASGITIAGIAGYRNLVSLNQEKRRKNIDFMRQCLEYAPLLGTSIVATETGTLTQMMQLTRLINTQHGLVLLYSATQIPFNVFLMYGYVESIPRELDEAAIVDGCGPIRLFFSVIFPLLTPVLVTAAVLSFVGTWSEFLFPLYYLNNSSYWPMTLAVYNFFGQFESDWNLVMADILLTILPVIVIYVLGQRFIVSGMTAGSVKG
ncbi:MAG: TIM barrel protein [Chloroflexi bacterium]|nr:TIM barrel protein [Chloroflexota bacterium]